MSLWLKKRARCTRCHKVKGEVAVTAGFVPFKVPGSPVVEKTVFPSPLSIYIYSRSVVRSQNSAFINGLMLQAKRQVARLHETQYATMFHNLCLFNGFGLRSKITVYILGHGWCSNLDVLENKRNVERPNMFQPGFS